MKPSEEELRARISGWVKEGKSVAKSRKQRNHALINLGLAAVASIQKGEKELEDFLRFVPEAKHQIIRELVELPDGK